MNKQKYVAGQKVYTVGCSILSDNTELTVSDSYKGGIMVSCIDEMKKYFFINESQLNDTRIGRDLVISEKTLLEIEEVLADAKEEKEKVIIPAWLKSVGNTYVTAPRIVYIYGYGELVDHAIAYIADSYVFNSQDTEIRCVIKSKTPWVFYDVPKECIYITAQGNYTTKEVVKKPLASEFTTFSKDHEYMIELLKEPKRAKVIEMVLRGVDLTQYDAIAGLKYFVLVPKKPTTAYMPMIMAHTDIQRNVAHPNDNLEYDPVLDKFSSPRGLGADDRAGCYAINKILVNHPNKFIIALFDEEEIGCIGSGAFTKAKEFAEIDKMASCYISIDRKRGYNGISQIATYGHDNKKLFDLIKESTGRLTVAGSSTDCKALAMGSKSIPKNQGLACFNMSCGYIDEHTASESLYFKELQTVVTDFDCMVADAKELWTEKFLAEKQKQAKTSYNNYWPSKDDEVLDVDGVEYDEADVRTLLWIYQQLVGKPYVFNSATILCKEFEKSTYVRLDTNCVPGGVYGGTKLTKDVYNVLNEYTWIVTEVKGMMYSLKSECATQVASNIPAAWLKMIVVSDPITQIN